MSPIHLIVALLPVLAFLAALWVMDSFRLVSPTAIVAAIGWGIVAAAGSLLLHQWLLQTEQLSGALVTRYVAPFTEETAKAILIVALITTSRVGFLVDAAIQGFAVGTGFALIENLSYLQSMSDAPFMVWVVRGLGTAVLQGATTTIFAMLAKTVADRRILHPALAFLPGWAVAIGLHSLFNQRLLPPLAQTLLILVVLPLLVLFVFARSEQATREWVGAGMDLDLELLNLVGSEAFAHTHFGRYLQDLRARMPGTVIVDMFCLLRLELELSVQAKALLIAREAGLHVPPDEDLEASLAERRALQESIGKTGLLVLKPLQVTSRRDAWHRHLLRQR